MLFALAAILLAGCGKSDSNTSGNSPANASGDYTGAMARSQAKAVGAIDLASLKQAIQLFNVQEARYPKDLNELVQSKLIGKIPDAPNGMKISYDPATGNVSLVSQ
jgi:hypothetical protein